MFSSDSSELPSDVGPFLEQTNLLRAAFVPDTQEAVCRVAITQDTEPFLFAADRLQGIRVSLYQSEGICAYAQMDRDTYIALCTLLGQAQWRVLTLNPLLVEEDLGHWTPSRCLFAPQPYKQDYALTLESPHVCKGCVEFYQCLGAENEILVIQACIAGLQRR